MSAHRFQTRRGFIRVLRGTAQRLFASTQVGDPVTIVKGSLAEKR